MSASGGMLFVISSPSGGGKSTVIDELRKRNGKLSYSVSATTRPPRKDEKEGIDYFFWDKETFRKKIEEHAFIEWAKVHGDYYGTLRDQIDRYLAEDRKVLLDVDIQGGLSLKKAEPQTVLIFLLPTSLEVLEKRLLARGTDSAETIARRIEVAKKEIERVDQYDFQIVNDNLEDTVKELQTIIQECSRGI